MKIPAEFDEIRPYAPEELPGVFDELLADSQFREIAQSFLKNVPLDVLRQQLHACKDNLQVQKTFFYPLLKQLLSKCSKGYDMDVSAIEDRTKSYTFVSNHRDIVLDSAILAIQLLEKGFPTTVEIAIGDNLLIYPWIKKLVRVNKSFIVQRSLTMREMLASSLRMSRYMHFAVKEKHENLWIAQREGRAKDSNDRTQESVLKMMAMGGEGTIVERLSELNIVPLTISYEFDPCDYLKAKEFQQKRDNPEFKKSKADDLLNMQIGINGYKGRIHYHMAAPVNSWISQVADLPKGEIYGEIARRMDKEMHRNYALYPINYVAADLLDGSSAYEACYSADEKAEAEQYLRERLSMIELPGKDEAFLWRCLLNMYANPLKNKMLALQ
mgnify:FL=1